jgi:hypothetical protein
MDRALKMASWPLPCVPVRAVCVGCTHGSAWRPGDVTGFLNCTWPGALPLCSAFIISRGSEERGLPRACAPLSSARPKHFLNWANCCRSFVPHCEVLLFLSVAGLVPAIPIPRSLREWFAPGWADPLTRLVCSVFLGFSIFSVFSGLFGFAAFEICSDLFFVPI